MNTVAAKSTDPVVMQGGGLVGAGGRGGVDVSGRGRKFLPTCGCVVPHLSIGRADDRRDSRRRHPGRVEHRHDLAALGRRQHHRLVGERGRGVDLSRMHYPLADGELVSVALGVSLQQVDGDVVVQLDVCDSDDVSLSLTTREARAVAEQLLAAVAAAEAVR